jgi:multidrug efflux pump subunit AcrB
MHSVRDAILGGIVLCVVVIALFLRDLRTGLIAALAVPLTLGMTFLPMGLLGQSLNLMSLGGLAVAIGLVIDDAIVVVEAIGRRIELGASPEVAAEQGTQTLLAALVGTTATTVVVFLPLAWLQGVVGRFFVALAATLSAAVLLSLLVAVLLIPLAAARFMRPRRAPRVRPSRSFGYERMLQWMVEHPKAGVGTALLLLAFGVWSARSMPTGFLPTMDEGAFVLDYFLPAGTSLHETDRVARKIEVILQNTKEVATYSRRTGAELGPAAATQVNRGDIMVRLTPTQLRQRDAEQIISELRARVSAQVPEARSEFLQVLQDVINDLSGAPRPIEIKLFGADYVRLRAAAGEIVSRIEHVPGLVDVYAGFEAEAPELRFRLNPANAVRLGHSARSLAAELDAALHGVIASLLRRPERPIDVRVRYPDEVRFDPAHLRRLPLVSPQGVTSFAAVTQLERGAAQTELVRENLRPAVIVTADHEQRDLGSVMRDVRARLQGLALPEGYRMELGGQYQSQQETFKELAIVLGFGLFAVLLVLIAQFRRARLAFLVLASVPLALVGAVSVLRVAEIPLNASSFMGGVLLAGLVVKNGILLLEQYETLCDQGRPEHDALIEAGRIRMRPIVMTTLATIAGLAPLALGIGAGAELQRPLAVTVIGGLVASTPVSLLLLPSLVSLVSRGARRHVAAL